ncbi:hypothetical protein EIP91_004223 [Steccherinum ochraceum]|uniref:HMG box domain-containing protein n=1 Tax=Steccherinum ochraceum TaxID=92696 RepID=A0A4R0RPN4_9APHY|nr:hypothetical protein EIP91_004223 [Steccherinum ochraceum]
MVKTATETQTKTATRSANSKPRGTGGKRAPSAYNKYVADNLKPWRDAHPDRPVKEAMAAVAAQWRDAPENPNRGQEPKKRTKKAPAEKPASGTTRTTRKSAQTAGEVEDAEAEVDEHDYGASSPLFRAPTGDSHFFFHPSWGSPLFTVAKRCFPVANGTAYASDEAARRFTLWTFAKIVRSALLILLAQIPVAWVFRGYLYMWRVEDTAISEPFATVYGLACAPVKVIFDGLRWCVGDALQQSETTIRKESKGQREKATVREDRPAAGRSSEPIRQVMVDVKTR